MAGRDNKGGMGSFARGAELWMHQARMLVVALWTVFMISALVGAVVGGAYFHHRSTAEERYALERNLVAELRLTLMMTNAKMELYVDGQREMLAVQTVKQLTDEGASEALRILRNSGVIGGLVAVGFAFLLALTWWAYGKKKLEDNWLRGAELVDGEQLAAQMRKRDDCSPYLLAGVPMRKGSETLNIMIAGAQGTGKSQQFFALMEQQRAAGKRAIVYDNTGAYTAAFYRDGHDILMNPLDARSPNWNIWNEIDKDYHFENMANGLIPEPAGVDPFWALAGRQVLKEVYRVLGREGKRTNAELYNAVAKSNLEAMYRLLTGTSGAAYVDPVAERTGMSLKMTVQNQLESFRFLHDQGKPFSIRRWIQSEDDSWMFITARESMREALKPVLSLWIDTAIRSVLELKPIHRERLWFHLDELPTLQKLDILKQMLTNGRKFGLCGVLGVQDFSQLYEIYGQHLARTIISGCQTKLLLRVTDGDAAKLLARLMGEAEIDEKEETLSYGLNSQRDGVSVFARRNLRDVVLTSQILKLPDMTGYITVPGDYPVGRVAYQYLPRKEIAADFIEREGFDVYFRPKLVQPRSERNGGGLSGGDTQSVTASSALPGSGGAGIQLNTLPPAGASGGASAQEAAATEPTRKVGRVGAQSGTSRRSAIQGQGLGGPVQGSLFGSAEGVPNTDNAEAIYDQKFPPESMTLIDPRSGQVFASAAEANQHPSADPEPPASSASGGRANLLKLFKPDRKP